MLKGKKIGLNLDSFLYEHPEIKIKRDFNKKITSIKISEDVQILMLYIKDGELYNLEYIYNDSLYHFSI